MAGLCLSEDFCYQQNLLIIERFDFLIRHIANTQTVICNRTKKKPESDLIMYHCQLSSFKGKNNIQ